MEETLVALNDTEQRRMIRSSSHGSDSDLELDDQGEGLDYRIHTKDTTGKKVSLWHDISLVHLDPESGKDTSYRNFVCEIPKFTR
jgi:inorganic pyrophosphatase